MFNFQYNTKKNNNNNNKPDFQPKAAPTVLKLAASDDALRACI